MQKKLVISSSTTITRETTTTELLHILLKNRSVHDPDKFLHPPLPSQLKPSDFGIKQKSLTKFISRIKKAIKQHEKILIYGDYDVDGITSTAILWHSLKSAGCDVLPFLPHRERDGYGLKYNSVLRFLSEKKFAADIILTIDNGISAKKEISRLRKDGFKIMIADHHLKSSSTPKLKYILHTTETSAAGIAWVIGQALGTSPDPILASLGLVADCVPLVHGNRALVHYTCKNFSKTKSPGLLQLAQIAQVDIENIGTYEIGFLLAPRLNAAGRLEDPTDSLRLLCVESPQKAQELSEKINGLNSSRQELQASSLQEAEAQIKPATKLLWCQSESFHPGVIGLISGKLTEKYYLPSISVSIFDGVAKGSCRSIPELHLLEVLEQVRDLCIDLGGHALAAGFSALPKNLPLIQKKLEKIIQTKLANLVLEPKLVVDAKMDIAAVTLRNAQAVLALEPYGISNPEPLFYFANIVVDSSRIIGKSGDHLKLTLQGVDSLLFKADQKHFSLKPRDTISFVARLSVNQWQSRITPQLLIKQIL